MAEERSVYLLLLSSISTKVCTGSIAVFHINKGLYRLYCCLPYQKNHRDSGMSSGRFAGPLDMPDIPVVEGRV